MFLPLTSLLLSTCSDKELLCRAGAMEVGLMDHSNHPEQVSFLDPCTPLSCFSRLLRMLHYTDKKKNHTQGCEMDCGFSN